MGMTDPIADMLTRLRNANSVLHDKVEIPGSKIKQVITINLKYGPNREQVITGIKRISKPGLRAYAKKDQLPRVLGGLGIAIISTSKGIMSDKQARREGVGGEVLAYVW